ncbi:MAG TPA: SEC-C domain-containing protein [Sporosarcina psychrophila]|uniref:SEC-C domain-containing protein n=1 Tax=Sporosarcina psychrophila TaxID=1476 RepID=A0A921FYA8_SPOPS|nr:SEC-C domain-containing protein [Sporosarcina psychrophila]
MIGRNDPCSCGSGKKYKKCCGSEGTNLVDMIVNEELDRILGTYFNDYPKNADRQEMMQMMREWVNRLTGSWEKEHIEEAASEFYLFIHNKKSWHTYLAAQLEQVKRDSVVSILEKWSEPFILLAQITEVERGKLKARELFSEKEYYVTRNEGMPADVGTLLFGVVLRDSRKGDYTVAPVSSMMFLAKWSKQTKKSLVELRETASDKSTEQFLSDYTLDIYELFIKRSMASMNDLVKEVLAPTQLSALTALDAVLRELSQRADGREIMHKLAVAYFLNDNQDVPVEEDFLAAAVNTGIQLGVVQDTGLTNEEVQQKFGAVNESMFVYEAELVALYADMMDSGEEPMAARVYDIGTDPRPTEKALWETSMTTGGVVQPKRKQGIAEGRAQLLAYEAYRAETEEERRKLAESAKEIGPDNPDVLLLQAEVERDYKKASELYEKAIQYASRTFEPGENPWQNIPNRPFMRAAFAYGIHFFSNGKYTEAAEMFTDLLRMNRTDNQGARYEAVASLIHAERFTEAAEIMVRYEKGSDHDAAYHYLDWKLEDIASEGKSLDAEEMLNEASKLNGHVRHLMTFKAKTSPYPRHQAIEPGSSDEARYIWLLLNGVTSV